VAGRYLIGRLTDRLGPKRALSMVLLAWVVLLVAMIGVQTRPQFWVVGACMLLRMEAVHDVGPFDDGYFMYSEELDWCMRAQRKGWETWFEPAAVATHRLGGSSRLNELSMLVESYRSMYRFYSKYYPPAWTAAARFVTRAAMLARALVLVFRRSRSRERLAAYREIARL